MTAAAGVLAGIVVVLTDQTTKAAWGHEYAANAGFAFGVADPPLAVEVACALLVVAVAVRLVGPRAPLAAGLLAGAALSQLVDRVVLGSVRDFIPFGPYVWNVADFAYIAGWFALIVWAVLEYRREVRHEDTPTAHAPSDRERPGHRVPHQ